MTEPHLDNDIIAAFKEHLNSNRVRRCNYKKQFFYRSDGIKEWLSYVTRDGVTNEVGLLRAVFDRQRYPFVPLEAKDIAEVRLLFALLVDMGCGHMIINFRHHLQSDSELRSPTLQHQFGRIIESLIHDEVQIPEEFVSGGYQSIIERFDDRRLAFVPAMIQNGMSTAFLHEKHVLPFFQKFVINRGGTATVYHCKIQTDLVCEELKDILKPSKNDDSKFGEYYELAVKTYRQAYEDIYRKETHAFKGMQRQEGLEVVKHLGEYRTHTSDGEYSDNILLELGEQDLDEYLADAGPPILNKETIKAWQSLFEVAHTLKRIHQLHYRSESGSLQQFNGWHGDIKPDNILRIRGKFKLADFGFAQFEKQDTCKTQLMGGTRTYGAPERDMKGCRDRNVAQSQTVDTWSFGCVLSAMATWVVLGERFYLCYSRIRQVAIQELRQRQRHDPSVSTPDADDAFHDGRNVLPVVLSWHNHLRNSARKTDTISYRVLDLVDKEMLVSDPEQRLTSAELCEKLDQIIKDAREEYESKVDSKLLIFESPDMLKALLDLDQHSPSTLTAINQTSANPSTALSQTYSPKELLPHPSDRVRKSECFGKMRIGKTANREYVLASEPRISEGVSTSTSARYSNHSQPISNKNPFWNAASQNTLVERGISNLETQRDFSHHQPRLPASVISPMTTNGSYYPQFQTKQPTMPSRTTMMAPNGHSVDPSDPNMPQTNRNSLYTLHDGPQSPARDEFAESSSGRHPSHQYTDLIPPMVSRHSFTPAGNNAILREYDELVTKLESSKGIWSNFIGKIPKDSYLETWIFERDIKFVIDNAESMKLHWDNVRKTLLVLAMKLGPLDEDGLDLVYASGQQNALKNVKGRKIQAKFEQSMKKAYESMDGVETDMCATLARIFDEYQSSDKKQTLIILTDGLWRGSGQNNDVENVIRTFINKLNQEKARFERRRFSIQFISFGDDPAALNRLQEIDDALGAVEDVVDAKPWHFHTVNSLILGSMGDKYDGETELSPRPTFESQWGAFERKPTATGSKRRSKFSFFRD